MNFGIIDLLTILGALGFFIYGMKTMSEGIQKVAGSRMRQILKAMTSNRVMGVLTGFLLTSLVQSSSATTVMVVSFVNAGLLSLIESIGVIMGANIGTTITAWIISIVGFKIKIGSAALPMIAFGFPMLFASGSRTKSWGEVIIGFALLFMGLDMLKASVPDIRSNPDILAFLSDYTDLGFLSMMLFVLIGTLLTVILQSSSATMALTLVMANEGWIPFDIAASMVLGENIGTTITANIAALVANVNAKRAALAHFIFNIFGVLWMLLLMPLFINAIDGYMSSGASGSPLTNATAIPVALSIFHTSFNVINVLALIWFTRTIAKIVSRFIKPKEEEDDDFKLEYITTSLLHTPELNLEEAAKEVQKFGEITSRMSGFTRDLLTAKKNKRKKYLKKIRKYEEITDRFEIEIADFLTKLSSEELSRKSSLKLRGLLSIANSLERIGDLYYQISLAVEKKAEGGTWFSEKQLANLINMMDIIDQAFAIMNANLALDTGKIDMAKVMNHEKEVNALRDKLLVKHLKNIEKQHYNVLSGMIYSDIYNMFERIGDYIVNVSEGINGEIARDEEDMPQPLS